MRRFQKISYIIIYSCIASIVNAQPGAHITVSNKAMAGAFPLVSNGKAPEFTPMQPMPV